jgi:hypothetical protein
VFGILVCTQLFLVVFLMFNGILREKMSCRKIFNHLEKKFGSILSVRNKTNSPVFLIVLCLKKQGGKT